MTASRLQLEAGDLRRCSTAERALDALRAAPGAVLVVDLTAFPDLASRVREEFPGAGRIVGFAPHVRTDLLDAARQWCDDVVPRGSMVKHFARHAGMESRSAKGDMA